MPKLKTCRGAAKRFKLTKNGSVKRSKAYTSHIMTSKSTKQKRNLRKPTLISKSEAKNIRSLIPYA